MIFIFGINILINPTIVATPIKNILLSKVSFGCCLEYFFSISLIFVIWYLAQYKLMFNESFERFSCGLPFSTRQRDLSDAMVILFSNNLLWLIFMLGVFLSIRNNVENIVFQSLYLAIYLISLQFVIHKKRIINGILIVLLGVGFVWAKYNILNSYILNFLYIFLLVTTVSVSSLRVKVIAKYPINPINFKISKLFSFGTILPIQLSMLRTYKANIIIKVLIAISIQAIIISIGRHATADASKYIIAFFEYASICTLTIISRLLATETIKMAQYFKSLPITGAFWLTRNLLFSCLITLIIMVIPAIYSSLFSEFGIGQILYLVFSLVAINTTAYVINFKGIKNTSLIIFFLAFVLFIIQNFLIDQ
jgi:hypothetical protein